MVEERQADGSVDGSLHFFGLFVGGHGVWIAWMVEVRGLKGKASVG